MEFIFSHFWKLEVQGQSSDWFVSGEGNLPGLLKASHVLLCSHMDWSLRESSGISPSFIRTPVPLDQGPTFMISSNPDYLLMAPSTNIITIKVWTLTLVASLNTVVILHFHWVWIKERTHLFRYLYLRNHSRKWNWVCEK